MTRPAAIDHRPNLRAPTRRPNESLDEITWYYCPQSMYRSGRLFPRVCFLHRRTFARPEPADALLASISLPARRLNAGSDRPDADRWSRATNSRKPIPGRSLAGPRGLPAVTEANQLRTERLQHHCAINARVESGCSRCSERTSNLALNSCPTLWACGPLYRAAMVQRLREKRPVRERNRPDGPRRGPEVLIKTRPKTGLISLRQGTGDSGSVGPVAEGVSASSIAKSNA
jgi:hypothetical protein